MQRSLVSRCLSPQSIPTVRAILWVAVGFTSIFLSRIFPFATDAQVYERTVQEGAHGVSPYVTGTARLEQSHASGNKSRTMNYIYPPATLWVLRSLAWLPTWLRVGTYWLAYAMATFYILSVQEKCLLKGLHPALRLLTPICVFFPALLNDDFLLAGNITLILYALVGFSAERSIRENRWSWFYLAVLLAAIVKPPMLTLIAVPMICSSASWWKPICVAAVGVFNFAIQYWIDPTGFANYVHMMSLEALYNNEFGFSPAGMLSRFLVEHHLGYQTISLVFYLAYATAILVALCSCANLYRTRQVAVSFWISLVIIGVILLNPRIKQYDAEIATMPLAVLGFGVASYITGSKQKAWPLFLILFSIANLAAAFAEAWDLTAMMLMVGFFSLSVWQAHRTSRRRSPGDPTQRVRSSTEWPAPDRIAT